MQGVSLVRTRTPDCVSELQLLNNANTLIACFKGSPLPRGLLDTIMNPVCIVAKESTWNYGRRKRAVRHECGPRSPQEYRI